MARRYARDAKGRFASSGASGAAARRNARRMAGISKPDAGKAFDIENRAFEGSRRVKAAAPERGSRSLVAQRTQAAQTYSSAVTRKAGALTTRKFESASFKAKSKQINKEMTADRLAKAQKLAKANPNSSAAKEALQLARMAAAVGGSHPKQRIKRKR